MVVSRSNRIFVISGWLLIVGFGLLAAPLVIIALTLPMPAVGTGGVEAWVGQNLSWLQVADELMTFGAPMILAGSLLFYNHVKKQYLISGALVVTLAIALTIGAISGVVLPLGRLVYPVNGLPIATGEMAVMTASQVFAGIHWLMLALAPYVITLSFIVRSRLVVVLAFVAAPLQVIGTYYAGEISVPLTLAANFSLLIWAIAAGACVMGRPKAVLVAGGRF